MKRYTRASRKPIGLGMVHVGETPRWMAETQERIDAGENPFEGAHCFEFHLPNGTIIRAGCPRCGIPASVEEP